MAATIAVSWADLNTPKSANIDVSYAGLNAALVPAVDISYAVLNAALVPLIDISHTQMTTPPYEVPSLSEQPYFLGVDRIWRRMPVSQVTTLTWTLPLYGATETGTPKTNDATVTVAAGGNVQAAIDAASSGAVICVSAADYSSQTITVNKPITVRATGVVTIQNAILTGGGATLEGFTVVGGVAGNPVSGINISGGKNKVINNLINGHTLQRGIFVASGTGNIIDHNTVHRINNYGIQVASGCTSAIVSRNNIFDLYDTVGNGLDVDSMRVFGRNHIVRDNYCHDIYQQLSTASVPHNDFFQSYQGTNLVNDNITFENNILFRTNGMIMIFKNNQGTTQTMTNYIIRGNVAEGYAWQAIILSGIDGAIVENNTLFGGSYEGPVITVEDGDLGAPSMNIRIQNNVIIRGKAANAAIGNKSSGSPQGVTLNSHNVTGVDPEIVTRMNDQEAPGKSHVTTRIVASDFTDYRARAQGYGTLIDAGNPLLSTGFTVDAAGTPRIKGAAIDIGAYEEA